MKTKIIVWSRRRIHCRTSGVADHLADDDAEIAPIRDVRKRVGLLTRQQKAALFGSRQSGFTVRATHLMAIPFRHEFGGAVQALFRLDHGAGREAIFAASVLAKFD